MQGQCTRLGGGRLLFAHRSAPWNVTVGVLSMLMVTLISGCMLSTGEQSSAGHDMAWQGVPGATGHLVLVGGGPRPESIMRKVLELSDDGTMLVIPMASGVPDTVGWEQRDEFLALGATRADILMLEPGDTNRVDLAEKIAAARGIWFSGGDQNRLMAYLGSGVLLQAVHEAYRRGAVIAGTSAGTAVMSRTMITGDERYPARTRDWSSMTAGNVITAPGIGFLNNMIVDQHFIFRSRLNRLVSVLGDHPEFLAAGIDEATALWIAPDGRTEVLGESQVVLLQEGSTSTYGRVAGTSDPTGATGSEDTPILQTAVDLRMHVIPPGGTFYLTDSGFTHIFTGSM
jgi:cyanophycinase